MELLKSRAGIDLVHVPYPGSPQVTAALMNGQIAAGFIVPATAMPLVQAGRLRSHRGHHAVRSAVLPDLPTIAEQGFPGFESTAWIGDRRAGEDAACRSSSGSRQSWCASCVTPEVRQRLQALYFQPVGTAPDGLAALMRERTRPLGDYHSQNRSEGGLMKIAVLGGGHGCYAAAADLAEQGHEVRMWRRDAAAFAPVLASQSIVLKDVQGPPRGAPRARHDRHRRRGARRRADRRADARVRAGRHRARHGAAHGRRPGGLPAAGHVRQLRDGEGGAATRARSRRSSSPKPARCPISRASTARPRSPSRFAPSACPPARFPARHADDAIAVIRQAYPSIEPIEDALSGALMNAGPIIHPPLILMNAGPLAALRQVGHPQRGHAAGDPRGHRPARRRAHRRARGAGLRAVPLSRCATTTPPTGGCTATRTTAWSSPTTGASTSTSPRTATCARTSRSRSRSSSRWPTGPASTRRSRAACSPWAARSAATDFRRNPRTLEGLGLAVARPRGDAAAAGRRPVSLPVIGALGAGRMGRGIAHAFAFGGHEVVLIDIKPRTVDETRALRTRGARGGRPEPVAARVAGRIRCRAEAAHARAHPLRRPRRRAGGARAPATSCSRACRKTLDAKREAFAYAGRWCAPTRSSHRPPRPCCRPSCAGFVARPERFLNVHWLNPAYLVPLVEISPHPGTAPRGARAHARPAGRHRQEARGLRGGARLHRAALPVAGR